MPPKTPTVKPKREADAFQLARQIYLARKRLHAKASQLFADAAPEVRALVEAHEAADADKSIELTPISPDSAPEPQPLRMTGRVVGIE